MSLSAGKCTCILNEEFTIGYICSGCFTRTDSDTCMRSMPNVGESYIQLSMWEDRVCEINTYICCWVWALDSYWKSFICRCQADTLSGWENELIGQVDALMVLGLGSWLEASRGHRNVPVGAGRHDQVSPEATCACWTCAWTYMVMWYTQQWLEICKDTSVYT